MFRAWLVLCACAALAGPVSAQQAAAVSGNVRADTGLGLEGVAVSVVDRTTGSQRAAETTVDGRYVIIGLPADGTYVVRAELSGFLPAVRDNVTLVAGTTLTLDFQLNFATAETVDINRPLLASGRSLLQQRLGDELIHSLPLLQRNFIQLVSLAGGFTGPSDFPSPQGQRHWANNVVVDGATHFSKWRAAPRAFHSGYGLESIREVQVLTNRFSAQYGEALASVTNVVTQAGTDEWRRTAQLFLQDDMFNSTPALASTKPPESTQQYVFSAGGPLVRNRTRFFGSYEGRRSRGHNVVVSPAATSALVPDNEDEHLLFARFDHQLGNGRVLMARYNGQRFRWHNEVGGLALPGTGTAYTNDVHTFLATDTWQVSSQLLNQLRFQFSRYVDVRRDLEPTVFVSRAGYSQQGGTLGPYGFGADPEDTWEMAETLTYSKGPHLFRMGGQIKHVRAHNAMLDYGWGAYVFAGAPDRFPQPYLFVQGLARQPAASVADPRSITASGWVQGDVRVRPTLMLNLGLRYDVERVSNVRGYEVPADKNNVQPRFGAAWDVGGSGRTLVRGGVGLYAQQHLLYYINRVELEGSDGALLLSLPPGSPLSPAFPGTLSADSLPMVLPSRDIHRVADRFRNPYALQSTIGVERIVFGSTLAADYVYLDGRDLMSIVDANAPASNQKPDQRTVADADSTRPMAPAPNSYRKIITLGNQGRSWYRALQIKTSRPFGRLRTVVSYTLSRAEDMANYQLPEDSRDLAAEKARAANDVKHNLALGATWSLPGEGPWRRDWSLAGLGIFRSNRPYDITWGDDRNGTTQNDARPDGRSTGTTDAYGNLDLTLARRFRSGSRVVEARVEAFNILDATNYNEYVGERLSPLFGQPVSAFPPRRFQFAVIVRF